MTHSITNGSLIGRVIGLAHKAVATVALTGMIFTTSVVMAPSASAEAVPAVRIGGASCPKKYSGSFLDIGRGECWACPSSAPARTVFAVDGPKACEQNVFKPKKPAIYKGKPGCSGESFQNGLSGECFKCPTGSVRNLNIAGDLTKIKACTVIVKTDKDVVGAYNLDGFDKNTRHNVFEMTGSDELRVAAVIDGVTTKWHTYKRISPTEFQAANSAATYTIEGNGSVTWTSADGRKKIILTERK